MFGFMFELRLCDMVEFAFKFMFRFSFEFFCFLGGVREFFVVNCAV